MCSGVLGSEGVGVGEWRRGSEGVGDGDMISMLGREN